MGEDKRGLKEEIESNLIHNDGNMIGQFFKVIGFGN